MLSGLANSAGVFRADNQSELNAFYTQIGASNYFNVVIGTAGSFSARTGWDFVTGVGAPRGLLGMQRAGSATS